MARGDGANDPQSRKRARTRNVELSDDSNEFIATSMNGLLIERVIRRREKSELCCSRRNERKEFVVAYYNFQDRGGESAQGRR